MKRFFITLYVIIILTSCVTNKSQCSETRALEIIPSEGIGPYELGMTEDNLVNILCPGYLKKVERAWFSNKETTCYFLKNMSFIFRNNQLKEINVWGTFKGSFEDIDMEYDRELLETHGEVIEHNGEYRILDTPNISFGKEDDDDNGKYIKIYQ